MSKTSPTDGMEGSAITGHDSTDQNAATSRDSGFRQLTPSEIASLQRNKRRAVERLRELRQAE